MSDNAKNAGKLAARAAAASGAVRQRRGAAGSGGGSTQTTRTRAGGASGMNSGGLWRFYTEDSTGLKIGPVPVLVMSLVFIAAVFILHIWGKYSRGH